MVFFCSAVNAGSIDLISKNPKIAVVIAGDKNMLSEEKTITEIDKQIEKKFPKDKFNVTKDNKVYQELLTIAENYDITNLDQLKRDDFIKVGQKFGYDYILVLPFYNEGREYTQTGWTNILTQKVTLRARILDINKMEYLYRLDVTKKGETGNAFGSPNIQRAEKEAIGNCLYEVFQDLAIGKNMKNKSIHSAVIY